MKNPIMMRLTLLLLWLTAVPLWAAEAPKGGAKAEAEPQGDPFKEALQSGATVAQLFLEYLKPHATTEFPGTLAWTLGAGATLGRLDAQKADDSWRALEPESLITRNAAWWQMFYEVAPGDPGLALLQAGTLLSAGDAQRAMIVLRLALNHKDLDAGTARIIISVMQHAGAFMESSHTLVREGLKLHDKGDYTGAVAKYDAALKVWPRNGWALYEKGFSVLINEVTNKNFPKGELPPLVKTLYARSREADPFQWNAWQGTVKEIPGLMEMQNVIKPLWDKSAASLNYQMTDAELTKLADTLQLARIDDLALVVRQVLIHHRGRYAPDDHPFIAQSLRRLAPGDRSDAVIAKLAESSFKGFRLYDPLEENKTEAGK
ncbi:hypothetical protein AYO49_00745 [Verrucomicrobiaceae bacterium SCGC AG-212-N21]|nr:hypothetical protein AYO49_00745 [Verrucomicrobiaceae bacterium SCGC AG-212-N21]